MLCFGVVHFCLGWLSVSCNNVSVEQCSFKCHLRFVIFYMEQGSFALCVGWIASSVFISVCLFVGSYYVRTKATWTEHTADDWLLQDWNHRSLYVLAHLIPRRWVTCSPLCDVFVPQLPEAFQGDENQGSAFVVSTDPQRPSLPAHPSSAHHSQRPEMRQHLHHGAHGLGQDRGPGLSHIKESILRQECDR